LKDIELGDESLQFYLLTHYLLSPVKINIEIYNVLTSFESVGELIDLTECKQHQIENTSVKNAFSQSVRSAQDTIMNIKSPPKLHRAGSSYVALGEENIEVSSKTAKTANEILQWLADRFIEDGSPKELNLPAELKKSVRRRMCILFLRITYPLLVLGSEQRSSERLASGHNRTGTHS